MIAYHEWQSEWWKGQVGANFQTKEDYSEGANAYAYRQASIRRRMRDHCTHAWRYVKQWVCLTLPLTSTTPSETDDANTVSFSSAEIPPEDDNEDMPSLRPVSRSSTQCSDDPRYHFSTAGPSSDGQDSAEDEDDDEDEDSGGSDDDGSIPDLVE